MYRIEEYTDENGSCPFGEWLKEVDVVMRAKIAARILRFENGNLGDTKNVGDGIFEGRIHLGPGYRIYFGKSGNKLIVLLIGGDKKS